MSAVSSGQYLLDIALAEMTFACFEIPAAIPTLITTGLLYSNPGAMEQAGHHWKDVAGKMEAMKNDLDQLVKGVPPEKWTAKDREAFNTAVDTYKAELTKVHDFHGSVGDALKIASEVFFAFAVLALAVGTALAAQALFVSAAWCTLFGGPPAEAEANIFATALDAIVTASTFSIKAMLITLGVIVGAEVYIYSQAKGMAANPNGGGPVMFKKATLGPMGMPSGAPSLPA